MIKSDCDEKRLVEMAAILDFVPKNMFRIGDFI